MHELTHQYDPIVSDVIEKQKYHPADVDYFKYINQPVEIRSHLQQVVEEIQVMIPRVKARLKEEDPVNYKNEFQTLRQKPLYLLHLSKTWRDIHNLLTPENEKRFLKAAAFLTRLI